jgi:hypothetical protein
MTPAKPKPATEPSCEACGKTLVGKRNGAKFCDSTCRSRASRRAKAGPAKPDDAPPAVPVAEYDSLADQIKASLTELEALATISGMAALRIAQQIDRGRDSGSAVATLTKELSRLVVEAKVESAPRRKDGADEIASRVIAKLQGLAS